MTNARPENIRPIADSDLPAVFKSADHASVLAQRKYLRLVKADLALLVIGTIATSWAIERSSDRAVLAIAGALALALGWLLTLAIKVLELDKVWFGARAIAESTKTLAWRYMTGANPYGSSLPNRDVDDLFCREVAGVLEDRRSLGAALAGPNAAADQITERMREVRSQDTATRKSVYLRDRIKDQQLWYAKKGEASKGSATNWLVAVLISQALAVVAAILLVAWPMLQFNFASVLSSLAGVLLAWLQVRRHQELAHAYGLASHDLGLVLAQERYVLTDDELSKFVMDSENAISREHIVWLARRDTL